MHQSSSETNQPIVGHVVPLKLMFIVIGTLLFLTVLTVAITWVDLGPMNIVAAMGIAVIKGSLVVLFFMHLYWDRPFNAFVLVFSLVLLGVFIVFLLLDSGNYQPEMIPDYAPALER